ncbi:MAG: 50S ribosomal protein L32 [Candidatus Heimdallarchaeota archaeon]|nr:50S ribosomal protein L32 [Candidatus Heimdallarchaeota archaeon]
MGLQKSKKSRSRRGMRRAHQALKNPQMSIIEDKETGEWRRPHHICTAEGTYGKKKNKNSPLERIAIKYETARQLAKKKKLNSSN